MRVAVHDRVDRVAELDRALDAHAVGEGEREYARLLVPLGRDLHHRSFTLAVVEPTRSVDEPEAPVAAHAVVLKLDLLRMHEAERLDRRDREAGDCGGHAFQLRRQAGPSTRASLRPRAPSSSTTQKSRPVTCTATL